MSPTLHLEKLHILNKIIVPFTTYSIHVAILSIPHMILDCGLAKLTKGIYNFPNFTFNPITHTILYLYDIKATPSILSTQFTKALNNNG